MTKEYKMLPIKRPENATIVQWPKSKPTLGAQPELVHYRILKLSDDKLIATICSDMTKLEDGQLIVKDVNIAQMGPNALFVGDVLAYKPLDTQFERPIITHRYHQAHQYPKNLIAPND